MTPTARSRHKLIVVALVAATLLAACSGGSGKASDNPSSGTGDKPQAGGSIVIARGAAIDGWEGDKAFTAFTNETLGMVFETLTTADPATGVPKPGLATSFTATGNTQTFKLRPNAKFSDGTPLTSADVLFSFKQWRAGVNVGPYLNLITNVTAPDATTVVVSLKQPDSFLPVALAATCFAVYKNNWGGQDKKAYFLKPIGSGPFVIKSEKVGSEIVLTKNPNYHVPGRPYLDQITIKTISDDNQRLVQFQSGDVDLYELVPQAQAAEIDKSQVKTQPSAYVEYLMPNHKTAPGSDPKFRKALSLGLDRGQLAKVLDNTATPADRTLPAPSGDQPGPSAGKWNTTDVTAAKAALKESGYKGQQLKLIVDGGRSIDSLVAQALQSQLAGIGVKAKIESLDTASYFDAWIGGKYDLNVHYTYPVTYSPADGLINAQLTSWLFSNAPSDNAAAQFAAYRTAPDDAGRTAALVNGENWAFDNVPYVPLLDLSVTYGIGAKLGGFAVDRLSLYDSTALYRKS